MSRRRTSHGGVDLVGPGGVASEPVVAVADVKPGVSATQRGDPGDVPGQVLGVFGGRDGPALLAETGGSGFGDGRPTSR